MDAVIVFVANYLYLFVILILGIAVLQESKDKRVKFVAAIIVSGIIAFILSRIAGKIYYDKRPFVREHIKPLFYHKPDNGFPSDHALLTGTLTAIAYFYNKKWATVMLIPTILIGIARVLARVHSPLDIAGGWVFGIIGSFAGYYLVEWYFKRRSDKSIPSVK